MLLSADMTMLQGCSKSHFRDPSSVNYLKNIMRQFANVCNFYSSVIWRLRFKIITTLRNGMQAEFSHTRHDRPPLPRTGIKLERKKLRPLVRKLRYMNTHDFHAGEERMGLLYSLPEALQST